MAVRELREGNKFDKNEFKKNCLIAERAIDKIIDANYDNTDDLTFGESMFIKNHLESIIVRCEKFLDDFGLTE